MWEFAVTVDGRRIPATPEWKQIAALCELCRSPVIAHCGKIRNWHWQHASGAECDSWHEPETAWHRAWKSYAKPDRREQVIRSASVAHRADVLGMDGTLDRVIELQHSLLDANEIDRRNHFYNSNSAQRGLTWLFDSSAFMDRVDLLEPAESSRVIKKHFGDLNVSTKLAFRWRHPRPTHSVAVKSARVYWDFGASAMLKVEKTSPRDSSIGYATVMSTWDFILYEYGSAAHSEVLLPMLESPTPYFSSDSRFQLYHGELEAAALRLKRLLKGDPLYNKQDEHPLLFSSHDR